MNNYKIIKQVDNYAIVLLTQKEVTDDAFGILNTSYGVIEATRPSYPAALMSLGQALEALKYAEANWLYDAKNYYSTDKSLGLAGRVIDHQLD